MVVRIVLYCNNIAFHVRRAPYKGDWYTLSAVGIRWYTLVYAVIHVIQPIQLRFFSSFSRNNLNVPVLARAPWGRKKYPSGTDGCNVWLLIGKHHNWETFHRDAQV